MSNKKDTGKILTAIALTAFLVGSIMTSMAYLPLADASTDCKDLKGFDRADCNVHTNTPDGFAGDQDIRFHEGTCQGGRDHPACDLAIITEPGNSDEHRQDD